jgi:hypothetical protein
VQQNPRMFATEVAHVCIKTRACLHQNPRMFAVEVAHVCKNNCTCAQQRRHTFHPSNSIACTRQAKQIFSIFQPQYSAHYFHAHQIFMLMKGKIRAK